MQLVREEKLNSGGGAFDSTMVMAGTPVGFCSLSLLERGNELQEDSQDSLLEYGKKQKTTVDTPNWSSSSSLELKSELLYHPPTEKQVHIQ